MRCRGVASRLLGPEKVELAGELMSELDDSRFVARFFSRSSLVWSDLAFLRSDSSSCSSDSASASSSAAHFDFFFGGSTREDVEAVSH